MGSVFSAQIDGHLRMMNFAAPVITENYAVREDIMSTLGTLIIFLLAVYTAWENLVNKRISKIGFDAWSLLTLRLFFEPRKIALIRKDKKRIRTFGLAMLLIIIGSLPYLLRT